jgi:hypothetical protein
METFDIEKHLASRASKEGKIKLCGLWDFVSVVQAYWK